ncbi:MAG: glycoside-pentoside-hexuronide (GPH):cation symporter [Clostridiales bacterium]|nr:glycoside-pentoside-hexuronide (GPH):cation symporter [Clostridiales bacterium]
MGEKLEQNERLSFREKFSYGCGEISCNFVFSIVTALLVTFYTDYVGVSAATVGIIIAISQVFNGGSDICAEFIVDRTRSKYGRARVWELRMAIPYAVAATLLMTVPQAGAWAQAIYIFITYNLMLTVVFTLTQLPFATALSYMTRSQTERAKTNIIRMTMSPIGNIACTLTFIPLVNRMGGGQDAWVKLTAAFGAVSAVLMLICFFNTKERVEVLDDVGGDKIPLRRAIPALFKNKYFIILFFLFVIIAFYQTTFGTMLTYYCKWNLGNDELMGVVNLATQVAIIIATPCLGLIITKIHNRTWVMIGGLLITVGSLIVLVDPSSILVMWAGALLRGLGSACVFAVMFSMITDCVEYGQWKTGLRTPGAIQSAVTSGQKFGQGLCSAAIGFIMQAGGYHSEAGVTVQSQQALDTIFNLFVYGIALIGIAMIVLMLFYHLDKEYPQIIRELLEREDKVRQEKADLTI